MLLTVSHDHQSVLGAPVQAAASTPLDFLLHLRIIWYSDLFLHAIPDNQSNARLSHQTCWLWTEGRGRDGGTRGRNFGWNILLLLLNELQQPTPRCCTLSVKLQKALFHTAHREDVRWCFLSKKTEKNEFQVNSVITPETCNYWATKMAQYCNNTGLDLTQEELCMIFTSLPIRFFGFKCT